MNIMLDRNKLNYMYGVYVLPIFLFENNNSIIIILSINKFLNIHKGNLLIIIFCLFTIRQIRHDHYLQINLCITLEGGAFSIAPLFVITSLGLLYLPILEIFFVPIVCGSR